MGMKNVFQTFCNRNGNEKFIPNFWEREWEASIPGNGREWEFPLTPAPSPIIGTKSPQKLVLKALLIDFGWWQ